MTGLKKDEKPEEVEAASEGAQAGPLKGASRPFVEVVEVLDDPEEDLPPRDTALREDRATEIQTKQPVSPKRTSVSSLAVPRAPATPLGSKTGRCSPMKPLQLSEVLPPLSKSSESPVPAPAKAQRSLVVVRSQSRSRSRSRQQRRKVRAGPKISRADVELCRASLASLPPDYGFQEERPHGCSAASRRAAVAAYLARTQPAQDRGVLLDAEQAFPRKLRPSSRSSEEPPPPLLGDTEQLQDDHLTWVIRHRMQPPKHVFVATPAQVALLQFGQESDDKHKSRDGCLKTLWDAEHIKTLLLPLNTDPQAGHVADGGIHWSLLVLRRRETAVSAELLDSFSSVSPGALKAAGMILLRISADSTHWKDAPSKPTPRPHGLQRDSYQCGIFCLLAIHNELQVELDSARRPSRRITPGQASRLRSFLQELGMSRSAASEEPEQQVVSG